MEILQEQINLMQDRLIEEGKRIPDEPLIIEYDNGGGQTGLRENPFYPAYEKLLSCYLKALSFTGEGVSLPDDLPSIDDFRKKFRIAK